MISSLGHDRLVFPQPCPDGRVLKDILEDDVPDKFYLSEKAMEGLKAPKMLNEGGKMNEEQNGIMIRNATKAGYLIAKEGDGIVLDNYDARGRVQKERSPTIMTRSGTGTVTPDLRIRRLTPRECWRLQGFGDDDFEIAKSIGTSDSQLYKQAGNSIAVPCLEAILRAMYVDKAWISTPSLDLFAKEE